jgi:hypothetical protein
VSARRSRRSRRRGLDDLWHRWRLARRLWRLGRNSARTLTSTGIVLFCCAVELYLMAAVGSMLRTLALELAICSVSVGGWLTYRWWRTGLTPVQSSQQLHRQRRTRSRWPKACKRAGLDGVPRLRKVASDGENVTALIHAAQVGVTRKELARGLETLADLTYCRQVTVKPRGPHRQVRPDVPVRGHPRRGRACPRTCPPRPPDPSSSG